MIQLDGATIKIGELRRFLAEACLEATVPHLTFRSAMSRFIRSGRGAYIEFLRANPKEKPYTAMINSAYLLGLDPYLAQSKYDLRARRESISQTMSRLKKDPVFSSLMVEETVDIELAALRERVEELRRDLDRFRVAKDFHEIEIEANKVKQELDLHRREEIKLVNAISQIDRSMKTKAELAPERVFQLYEEAQAALPESVQTRVEEVLAFHDELQSKRIYRLSRERRELARELVSHRGQIEVLSADLDERLRYLSEHRALDEYVAVNNELSRAQQKMVKLEESKDLRSKVAREMDTIDVEMAQENLRTGEYLERSEALIEEAISRFRSYAQELYGSRPSGLSITSDSGDNSLRYRIDAHIRADAAEGINEAKIFCFDMTLLTLGRGHRFSFLAHDSTLFGPVDPRQR